MYLNSFILLFTSTLATIHALPLGVNFETSTRGNGLSHRSSGDSDLLSGSLGSLSLRGLGHDIKDLENDATGQGGIDGGNGSNGKTEDTPVDPALDQFASEGLLVSVDPEINNLVNDEINKFSR